MTGPISRHRFIGSLKEAASWPGADRNTVVALATALVAIRTDNFVRGHGHLPGVPYFSRSYSWS